MENRALTQKDIARFTPHGLKVEEHGNVKSVCLGFNRLNNKDRIFYEDIFTYQPIIDYKPILRNINTLTQEQWLEGYDEPVVPLVELAKIAFPETVAHSIDSIFCLVDKSTRFFFDDGAFNAFKNSEHCFIRCQTKMFDFLETHKFNAWGIPDNLVKYVTQEFNPYTK